MGLGINAATNRIKLASRVITFRGALPGKFDGLHKFETALDTADLHGTVLGSISEEVKSLPGTSLSAALAEQPWVHEGHEIGPHGLSNNLVCHLSRLTQMAAGQGAAPETRNPVPSEAVKWAVLSMYLGEAQPSAVFVSKHGPRCVQLEPVASHADSKDTTTCNPVLSAIGCQRVVMWGTLTFLPDAEALQHGMRSASHDKDWPSCDHLANTLITSLSGSNNEQETKGFLLACGLNGELTALGLSNKADLTHFKLASISSVRRGTWACELRFEPGPAAALVQMDGDTSEADFMVTQVQCERQAGQVDLAGEPSAFWTDYRSIARQAGDLAVEVDGTKRSFPSHEAVDWVVRTLYNGEPEPQQFTSVRLAMIDCLRPNGRVLADK